MTTHMYLYILVQPSAFEFQWPRARFLLRTSDHQFKSLLCSGSLCLPFAHIQLCRRSFYNTQWTCVFVVHTCFLFYVCFSTFTLRILTLQQQRRRHLTFLNNFFRVFTYTYVYSYVFVLFLCKNFYFLQLGSTQFIINILCVR